MKRRGEEGCDREIIVTAGISPMGASRRVWRPSAPAATHFGKRVFTGDVVPCLVSVARCDGFGTCRSMSEFKFQMNNFITSIEVGRRWFH